MRFNIDKSHNDNTNNKISVRCSNNTIVWIEEKIIVNIFEKSVNLQGAYLRSKFNLSKLKNKNANTIKSVAILFTSLVLI